MNESLERTSIYYQYHIFHAAKVVIAQHGGALCNTFFMQSSSKESLQVPNNITTSSSISGSSSEGSNERNGDHVAKIIEIIPKNTEEAQRSRYRNLAHFCQVQYVCIEQSSELAEVDIGQIVQETV
mmetsp:Transcript_19430/g.26706  ORF Transcript_19430/g.26706 Transcript_19430/m.26706 type:complete len:126 (-) Transcript_19430:170-547(-)|eukprot:CAMPEP_0201094094 /NCGR_PEP_ID=MMETSP0812-20130820/2508_1 /ASSEMBLY_ACC=CAM_ASM_000668 /TAXON_ID=98059 /ORGANISM="Dinobryon sp., Strain UTEXLB2267" /LENGTH=125 /DNA_ID=CAMNT_0047346553 /DNA_START=734 /DNA_END=1111 /DNA_ORIENTATION=-